MVGEEGMKAIRNAAPDLYVTSEVWRDELEEYARRYNLKPPPRR